MIFHGIFKWYGIFHIDISLLKNKKKHSSAAPAAAAPCLASRVMLHSALGDSAGPLKTVSAVGATKDLDGRGTGGGLVQGKPSDVGVML